MKLFPGYEAPPAISEAQLQQAVIEAARTFRFRCAHFRPARTKHGWVTPVAADGKGWPDLTLVHLDEPRLLFVELKSATGKVTAEQQAWLDGLARVAAACPDVVEVHVWTPEQWNSGEIVEVLSGRPLRERSAA